MTTLSCDVAILGGGAAGSAAALSLLHTGADVVVIDPADFSTARIGESIPPDANLLLDQLGVRDAFLAQNHLPCYGSHSKWGSDRVGHNDFMISPHGHGWHLDRARFDEMLLEQAVLRGARLVRTSVTGLRSAADRISAVITPETRIMAKTYIDATGRAACVARHFGVKRKIEARHVTLWAYFTGALEGLGHATWLQATPYGWWYAAALPGDRAVVALGTTPREAKTRALHDLRSWAFALTESDLIAPKLRHARLDQASFRSTASTCYQSARVSGENWLLVGDAASALDPLSSAGIYKALWSGGLAAMAVSTQDFARYASDLEAAHLGYQHVRAELYETEYRWRAHPFWKDAG